MEPLRRAIKVNAMLALVQREERVNALISHR